MRGTTYCKAVANGDNALTEWDFLWKQFLEAEVATERNNILRAFGCSKEPWILNRLESRGFPAPILWDTWRKNDALI